MIENMFDDAPLGGNMPPVADLVPVGDEFWVRPRTNVDVGEREGFLRWYVVDPDVGAIVAVAWVPEGERLLSGNGRSVVLLGRTELDEEYIVVRNILPA